MTIYRRTLILASLVLLAACDNTRATGQEDAGVKPDGPPQKDTAPPGDTGGDASVDMVGQCPCTDPVKCAEPWTCDGSACSRAAPRPNTQAGWTCTWLSPMRYSCTHTASSPFPPGSLPKGWYCGYRESIKAYECLRSTTPHPCSQTTTEAAWSCQVKGTTILCHSTGTPRVTSPKWSCWTEGTRKLCKVTTTEKGLPPSNSKWRCHRPGREGHLQWVCHGTAAATPMGGGWACAKEASAAALYRCTKMLTTHDLPTGEGYWVTSKSWVTGTQSEQMTPGATASVNYKCKKGHRMWCDGLQYSGWGEVKCTDSGAWATKMVNGKAMLDCQEHASGLRPNTRCACYHFFLNRDCCERPDCVVPSGGPGRVCAKSAGALCDHCNPLKPECVEAQARCIVTNNHETFCGRLCSDAKPCPTGYKCLDVKLKVGTIKQCIPADLSCYY